MDWAWILPATGGAILVFAGRFTWDWWSRRSRRRPEATSFHASYNFHHNCVNFGIDNQGHNEIEIERLIAQFHDSRKRKPLLSGQGSWSPPLELQWQNMWPEERLESHPNKILPGGSAQFSAGNKWLGKQAPDARWLTVQAFFSDGTTLRARTNLVRMRKLDAKWSAKIGSYEEKPGEKTIESEHMRMLVPSYPPRWVPAKEIITTDDPRWRE